MALDRTGELECIVTADVKEMMAALFAERAGVVHLECYPRRNRMGRRQIDGVKLAQLLRSRSPRKLPILLATGARHGR